MENYAEFKLKFQLDKRKPWIKAFHSKDFVLCSSSYRTKDDINIINIYMMILFIYLLHKLKRRTLRLYITIKNVVCCDRGESAANELFIYDLLW